MIDHGKWASQMGTGLPQPDPPLMNPYMEGVQAVEGILSRLHTFTKEFPGAIDFEDAVDYRLNLLSVRDTLHGLRQKEMEVEASRKALTQ
jgi:hypothetical protein